MIWLTVKQAAKTYKCRDGTIGCSPMNLRKILRKDSARVHNDEWKAYYDIHIGQWRIPENFIVEPTTRR